MNDTLEKIETIRKEKGISRYRLANDAKIPQTTLSNMLKNNTMPTLSTLQKICEGLGITMAQFFVEEGTRIDLTDQQKELLSLWDSLPLNMQARVIGYLEGLKEKNK